MATKLRRLLLLSALVMLAAAVSAWVSGGWAIELAGVPLRVRRPLRVAVPGAVLLAVWAAWAGRHRREDGRAIVRLPWTSPGLLSVGLAAVVCLAGVTFGTFAASGSDPYGYISEADLLLEGRLRVPQDLASAPWPEPVWTLSPLGYRPATVPGTIVPTYPPGLPLLFAGARAAAGPCAPFYVVPLLGALLVWLTYRLGLRLVPAPLALASALLVAVSAPFVFQLMWPMSDVPVATLWLAAALFAVGADGRTDRRSGTPGDAALATRLAEGEHAGPYDVKELPARPLAAGLLASLAILVRPNLAPLAAVCLLAMAAAAGGGRQGAGGRGALRFLAGLLPGVILLAAINTHLYGAGWRLGYSSTDEFYSIGNMIPNLRRYGGWMIDANTPVVLLALAPLVAWARFLPSHAGWRILLTGMVAGVWLSYLPYFQFEDWWYLRFLLPAWPALAVLTVAALHGVLSRLLSGGRAEAASLAIVLVLAGVTFGRAKGLGALGLRAAEQRYVDVGQYVAVRTPPGSVVLSMQHSGSIRYYGRRTTIRYDLLEPEWLDRAIAFLEGQDRRPFILLEDWEVPAFRARFAGAAAGDLSWSPVAEWRNGKVLLFDATERSLDRSPERIPPARDRCAGR